MAPIPCPACGKQIPDREPKCPSCVGQNPSSLRAAFKGEFEAVRALLNRSAGVGR